jgi:hypothetical protein
LALGNYQLQSLCIMMRAYAREHRLDPVFSFMGGLQPRAPLLLLYDGRLDGEISCEKYRCAKKGVCDFELAEGSGRGSDAICVLHELQCAATLILAPALSTAWAPASARRLKVVMAHWWTHCDCMMFGHNDDKD